MQIIEMNLCTELIYTTKTIRCGELTWKRWKTWLDSILQSSGAV